VRWKRTARDGATETDPKWNLRYYRIPPVALAFAVCSAIGAAAFAQRGIPQSNDEDEPPIPPRAAEFHFIRTQYTDLPEYHRRWGRVSRNGSGSGWWDVDWPAADNHFTRGIQRLTRIDVGDPRHLRLTDEQLFDYPWIYATQTGWWDLSNAEVGRLREYLLRGGFLVVDDFWGATQWNEFRQTMDRVLPNHPILDIDESDSVMHVLYDIGPKDLTFIPGSRHLRRMDDGSVQVVQPEGTAPAWRAIYDDRHRMVVAINFDTDVGDAWEFADVPIYPEAMTELAYRFGINYIVYSMTH
jgi:Domain of unknown function (DUF4159)